MLYGTGFACQSWIFVVRIYNIDSSFSLIATNVAAAISSQFRVRYLALCLGVTRTKTYARYGKKKQVEGLKKKSPIMVNLHFGVELRYTWTRISLRFTWLSMISEIKPRVVTVMFSRAILVTPTSECRVKRIICKTWTGTLANGADPDQTPQNAASDQSLQCLFKLQEVKG